MKLKEYLYYLIASEPVTIADAEVAEQLSRRWFDGVTTFADKTLIPKEALDLEVRKFGGDTYFPGDFCPEEEKDFYDAWEDWFGCVQFYVEGYQKVKEKLKLKEIVK